MSHRESKTFKEVRKRLSQGTFDPALVKKLEGIAGKDFTLTTVGGRVSGTDVEADLGRIFARAG